MINKTKYGTYRVRIKHRGKVIASRTFKKRKDAMAWESQQRVLLGQGQVPTGGRVLLRDYYPTWLKGRKDQVEMRTWDSDESAFRVHILPMLGALSLQEITTDDCQALVGRLLKAGKSPNTARRVVASLSALLESAVRRNQIARNPALDVRIKKGRTAPIVQDAPVSPGVRRPGAFPFEAGELLEVVAEQRCAAPGLSDPSDGSLFMGITGLRWGEFAALTDKSVLVSEDGGLSVVVSQVIVFERGGGAAHLKQYGKSHAAQRTVPIPEVLRDIVMMRMQNPGFLFAAPGGGPQNVSNFRRSVRWQETARGRRVHDLRHTAASLLIADGCDVVQVSKLLGHSSPMVTLRFYAHVFERRQQSAVRNHFENIFTA
jgi:integrase